LPQGKKNKDIKSVVQQNVREKSIFLYRWKKTSRRKPESKLKQYIQDPSLVMSQTNKGPSVGE
jgi:hypothetical protein